MRGDRRYFICLLAARDHSWIRGVAQSGHGMAGMSTHVAVVSNALNALSTAALALVAIAVFPDRRETRRAREGVKRIAE
jgi:hypothetical protein